MNTFFKLKENGTTVNKELVAGATTFFAMVYIIFVNPAILGDAGMPTGAVFLATIFATVIGTLVMGLFANVPYAVAPGMGLNAFFTYTVVMAMGFTWQEALGMVFVCGLINILITVTKVRKHIVKSIPVSLQHAIGGGIGLFIAYIGIKNAELLNIVGNVDGFGVFDSGVIPELTKFDSWAPVLAIIGLIVTIVLLILNVKGAILIGIIFAALVGIPMGLTVFDFSSYDITTPFKELDQTVFAAFRGLKDLFATPDKLPVALFAIFAFSLTDTFDTIGTFIGTGRKSGIFTAEDVAAIEDSKGFKTKMEKALFADSIATSIGAVFGTSNTTTYVESAAGIEAGGRTGLTSVFVALFFALCIFISPIVGAVPAAATAPALIIVGIMMASAFKEIDWHDFAEAVPAFFAAVFMTLAYNISIGIAFGFIFYVIIKLIKKEIREVHPILLGSTALFLLYFVLMALDSLGVF
ncbi:MAG TPA: NCS2 family permease [Acholeplasmataceae bacterium]|nr:NCS2 family permease [Acholeplasmataceae bacterium]